VQNDELKQLIEQGLPGAQVSVDGDGRHFQALIVSEGFVGKSMLQQHRMVYDVLGDRFANETVHALSLRTFTPEQWQARGGV